MRIGQKGGVGTRRACDSSEISRFRRSMGQLVEGVRTIRHMISGQSIVVCDNQAVPISQALAGAEGHGRYINGSESP
jgi:hypothetical protein